MDKKIVRELLKQNFAATVSKLTGADYEFEYKFAAPERQWRSDIAFPAAKVAVEIDGGIWTYGRHNRAASMLDDMEKGNGYAARGWLVFHTPWEWIDGGRRDRSRQLIGDISGVVKLRIKNAVELWNDGRVLDE